MLDFYGILWVIPGVIFIYIYNKFRPDSTTAMAVNLSGWPYLFFLVVIAALTWFPAELIVDLFKGSLSGNKLIQKLCILLLSMCFVYIVLRIAQRESVSRLIFLPVQDNFYKKCVEWENKEIF